MIPGSGRLFVANPGLGVVWVLDRLAEPELVLRGPRGASLTNIAFRGDDRKTVVVTDSTHGTIFSARMDAAGVALVPGPAGALWRGWVAGLSLACVAGAA